MTGWMYVGAFTPGSEDGRGIGISLLAVDPETGGISDHGYCLPVPSPTFLAVHPVARTLYAVNAAGEGSVAAFAIGDGGDLRQLGSPSATGGQGACHVAVAPDGQLLAVANYWDGSISLHRLEAGGAIAGGLGSARHAGSGPHADRQEGPHAHSVTWLPSGHHLVAADLGADALYLYRATAAEGLVELARIVTHAGAGPRHVAVDGTRIHVACELDSTVETFHWDGADSLTPVGVTAATATPPGGENFPSEIIADVRRGRLFVANRGANVVTVFDVSSGLPMPLADIPCGGAWPRHLALDGPNLYVANQESDSVTRIAWADGPDGRPSAREVGSVRVVSPACLVIVRG